MTAETKRSGEPARLLWLPPFLHPPAPITRPHEKTFLLVGFATFFAGYSQTILGLAILQIQNTFHISENRAGLTVSYIYLGTLGALGLVYAADMIGRRRLLLVTVTGQAIATLGTALADSYAHFVWMQLAATIFADADGILCLVVIMEELEARVRGWAAGTLAAMNATGSGIAVLAFALINALPFGWRAIYVLGALPLFLVAFMRRALPETRRFQVRESEVVRMGSRVVEAADVLRRMFREYPLRIVIILVVQVTSSFATASAGLFVAKFLQQSHGYSPGQVSLLFFPGGAAALAMNVLAGKLSDRIGRRRVIVFTLIVTAAGYGLFYSPVADWLVPLSWIASFFGSTVAGTLIAGYAAELVPTAYRATVSGLRAVVGTIGGASGLALEGILYDAFHAHGPAVLASLLVLPVTIVAVFMLPESAGRVLEEISGGPEPEVDERQNKLPI